MYENGNKWVEMMIFVKNVLIMIPSQFMWSHFYFIYDHFEKINSTDGNEATIFMTTAVPPLEPSSS